MDPDATLASIRQQLEWAEQATQPGSELHHKLLALHAYEDLDRWLSTGGFLPKEWQR